MWSTWKCQILAFLCIGSVLSQSDSNLDDDDLWSKVANSYTELSSNDYYYAHDVAMTWEEAVEYCAAEGSHLFILNSQQEADVVVAFMPDVSPDYFWSGFSDLAQEGTFVTLNNQTVQEAGYVNWANGEPSGYYETQEENCGAVESTGEMYDRICSAECYFICEHVTK
ncbi:hypothetical protein L9F63_020985 [Diploptera punctata]|uniref:C-type lectin domain-containing protein n=1 Tax=Diploptera punctata TaxID=6984 RepID=A0AAD8ECG1_DIPPU|nr:hypothetical protein L9F63_020985 [Diploptera punctata]